MHKANGRLKPTNTKEVAGLKDKQFKCTKCDKVIIISNTEFATELVCDACGGSLQEVY